MKGDAMRDKLAQFVTAYAEAHGCEADASSGSVTAALVIDGVRIGFAVRENSGSVVVQAGVGLLPDQFNASEREQFYAMILEANNLFGATEGATLGLDREVGLVTLQATCAFVALEMDGFTAFVDGFLETAANWMGRLESWRPGADDEDSSSERAAAIPDDFLRV